MSHKARLSIRIDLPGGHRLGPGKAKLLEAISEQQTLRAAAEELGMSYPKALKLINQLNSAFPLPLVLLQHGGATRGSAELTAAGQNVLKTYRQICERSNSSSSDLLASFTVINSERSD